MRDSNYEIPTDLPMFLRSSMLLDLKNTCANIVLCQGEWYIKDGGLKPEVDIYNKFTTNPDVEEYSD